MDEIKIQFLLILLCLIGIQSCDKEEEFVSIQSVRVENLTDENIDTFIIGGTYGYDFPMFADIQPGSITDYKICEYIGDRTVFRGKISNLWFSESWELPSHFIDPSGMKYLVLPNGSYTFAIISYDTINLNMKVGLTEYHHKVY